jgi:hypothetical protein
MATGWRHPRKTPRPEFDSPEFSLQAVHGVASHLRFLVSATAVVQGALQLILKPIYEADLYLADR